MQAGRKLVLFLDDFGFVTQNESYPLDFFSFMRSVANSHDVGYVTTSAAALQTLCHTQDIEESPFFNIFTTVNLEPFNPEAARELVEKPAADAGAAFSSEVVGGIIELAGGTPYLLQLTAATAFGANESGRVDLQKLAEDAYSEARSFLDDRWSSFSDPQKEVMTALCAGKGIERRHEYAAEQLERRGTLQREGETFVCGEGLMKRFVAEQGKGGFFKRLFG